MKLEISRQIFEKNTSILNFVKIRTVGAELFGADGETDGQTDMTKLVVTLRSFLIARKMSLFFPTLTSVQGIKASGASD